ncbi:hypothetical protein [Streptosporangium saharense]|uniref:Chitinase n=1 Tax=Streptosporangium saharense TaxID=1706840 RepID=A0A7W7VNF4_9ACTN|nr:hypothetical protein [Streptosporangium saharense]MBB4916454.1 hypothetical protein [Streptosporangium saharense]
MSVATEPEPGPETGATTDRRLREPGTPPRSLVVLASLALAAGTGAALWILPSGAVRPARAQRPIHVPPAPVAPSPTPSAVGRPGPVTRPSGFVTFVDAARTPSFAPPETSAPGRAHWFTLGHLTAGGDGCTPVWSGRDRDLSPARRLEALRAAGGEAGLVFGGPGRELAATCTDLGRLTGAYRRAVSAFDAGYIDFELGGRDGGATVLRRAAAIASLQREAAATGRTLTVSFTLPADGDGLSRADQEMLRMTRERGAEISTVSLMVPIRAGQGRRSHLRPIAAAVRAAHPQIVRSLGGTGTRCRIALSPFLTGAKDLTTTDARKLVAFSTRKGMAWLSTRGATPSWSVSRLLVGLTH